MQILKPAQFGSTAISATQASAMPQASARATLPLASTPSLRFAGAPAWQGYAGIRFGANQAKADEYENLVNSRRYADDKAPIRLSPEQRVAIEALAKGRGVVMDIPTGTGKTLVAEYAIDRALENGKRVYYTSPLKALSNQKYLDFCQQYGAENVGLKTGDSTTNPDAPIVVMTTEVYRNMLYEQRQGEANADLDNLSAVVFDECHYIDDPDRGVVWEEAAIYTPPGVQQVHLSATIDNAGPYTDWLNSLNVAQGAGPNLELVSSRERAVPLVYEFLSPSGQLVEMLDRRNPEAMSGEFKKSLKELGGQSSSQRGKRKGNKYQQKQSRPKRVVFNPAQALETLQRRNRLPADFLVFSRKKCEQYARAASQQELNLLNADESQRIEEFINKYMEYYPELRLSDSGLTDMLKKGVAYHHGGLLPPEKLMVELLLQRGLVKATFSTDTLTTGMNVPFRTMVVTATSKYGGNGIEPVSDSSFQQAVGRAGRPGMFNPGYAILTAPDAQDPSLHGNPAQRLMGLVLAEPNRVESQLNVSTGLTLNLLSRYSMDKAEALLDKSFASFQRGEPLSREFRQTRKFLTKLGFISNNGYVKPVGQLSAEIPNDHSLAVSKMIASGGFNSLSAKDLAVVLSLTVQENGRAPTLAEMKNEKGKDALSGQPAPVQKAADLMHGMVTHMNKTLGQFDVIGRRDRGFGIDSDLFPARMGFVDELCKAGDADKLEMIQSEEFPGGALNVVQRTANLLKHIAEAESPLVKPELKAKAAQAMELLMGPSLRNLVEPQLMELPD